MSATNQEKTIATKGSPHVARSGPPDVCLLPDKKTPVAPPNEVPTTRATTHTTGRTVIDGHPIVQKDDNIGPLSDPAHAGTAGGIKSQTYRKEANPTSGSPNVRTEANQPARHEDPTDHNHKNTTGTLIDTSLNPKADAAARKPEERCTVTEVILICTHDGRQTTPKDPALDVLEGDTVTATATRRDLLKPGEPLAVCPPKFPGRHEKTKFTVTRSGPEAADKKGPEFQEGQDTYKLSPGDWIGGAPKGPSAVPTVSAGSGGTQRTPSTPGWTSSTNKPPNVNDYKPGGTQADARAQGFTPPPRSTANESRVDAESRVYNRTQGDGTYNPAPGFQAERQLAVIQDDKDTAKATEIAQQQFDQRAQKAQQMMARVRGVIATGKIVTSLAEIVKVIQAKPKVITIEAQGCAGSQTRTLRSYPAEEASCDLMKLKEVMACFAVFKSALQIGETVSNAVGLGKFKFTILDPISCTFTVGWKELEKDAGPKKPHLTRQRANKEWGLAVGGSLVDFWVEGRIPIATLVGAAGAAKLANWIRDKFKVGADALLTIKLGLAISFVLRYNRYEEITLSEVAVNPSIDVSFGISLQGGRFGVTVVVGVVLSPVIVIKKHDTKIGEIILQAGKAEIYFQATVQYDVLGWKDEINGRWVIRELPYGEQKTDVAAWIGG